MQHHISVAFPLWLQIAALFGLALGYGFMLRHMIWDDLFVPGRVQQFLLATVAVALVWSMRAESVDGLALHFLGVAVVTLVFGWQMALLIVSLAVLGLALFGIVTWLEAPLMILLSGALPIAAAWALLRFSERKLPPHMFIYLYVVGFLGGALTVLVTMIAYTLVFGLFTSLPWDVVVSEYFQYTLLLVLPEGVLNGMIITGLVMFRPEWVATYSDARYVDGR